MEPIFERLLRFRDSNGAIQYGEAPASDDLINQVIPTYTGTAPWNLQVTGKTATVAEILCPLPFTPLIYGIGLNYKTHIAESNWPTPPFPTVFTKPPGALNGPFSDVHINPACEKMDYEGELAVILGQDCKNVVSPEEALQRVLGYAASNDVSSRHWQNPVLSGQQHGYAKSFDGFAPLGPVIVAATAIKDLQQLTLVTKVNGEERQRSSLDDLLFGVGDIIVHLSRGTTLKAGTVIMTGTPGGVAAFLEPPRWLGDGDVVEVSISEIGTIRNRHVIEK